MCTVTYIPSPCGYTLTQNRDEKHHRSPKEMSYGKAGNFSIQYPQDKGAKGTWIFHRNDGLSVCLLNGAFANHTKLSAYKKSRGKIMLDLAKVPDFLSWYTSVDLKDIEPFTLVVRSLRHLYEFRWDSEKKHLQELNINQSYIWSSSTLYTETEKLKRQNLFRAFLEQTKHSPDANEILDFHLHGDLSDPRINLRMIRDNGTQTLSITQINNKSGIAGVRYIDLLAENEYESENNSDFLH
jgi:hypothetical protein